MGDVNGYVQKDRRHDGHTWGFAGEANGGAGTVASLSQANSAAQNSGWFNQFMGGLGGGLGKGLSSFATGGLSESTGWGYDPSSST